ncbi:beta-lactamase/D-alanine carboxypeptidase [Legionella massiliensis]|uniref:Beta-lactamase/D-alanine carboxypeptidase n=1 Tax=Legionella massiliensis TaxID=1034943 RepID=A0A078KU10_9GAMM|nr:serine hydrolase domain-containing protein [Legionella massiliensis]CDZ76442.1 beta-lactamase/D-alanine carboxypeptidase [Legionella massiliensis]CEE12180.1 beta-lactamase/D-alanine carboxypeptidase [Legionella massiliensis]
MQERQELMNELLDNANIPALSLSWCQKGVRDSVAYGTTDTSAPSTVDTNTLFQAASLSKPVSAAIVLDLVAQGKWDLDKPLAEIADYGPPELRQDPHYRTLTTRMVIGQCSGLANFGQDGDDGKKFIAAPNTRFTYSGVALDFLKDVIEQETQHKWEDIAQDFFKRAGMTSSTFMRQLPDGNLHDKHRDIAQAHMADPSPDGPMSPLAPLGEKEPGIPAGSMLTTAEDYISFLQYCFQNDYLKSTLLTGALSTLPPTASPETSNIQWGLGMGVYNDQEKTIGFHWGNNTGSISFCAMDLDTGDCVVSFANSMNGPSVFQQVAEPIVGDIKPLFEWLSTYCAYSDITPPKAPDTIASTVHSIRASAVDKRDEVTERFKHSVGQLRASQMDQASSSNTAGREGFNPSPLETKPKPPWEQ